MLANELQQPIGVLDVGWTTSIVTAVAVLAATLVTTPAVIHGLHDRAVLDRPNRRSSHEHLTVRGAGLALAAAASLGISVASPAVGAWVAGPAAVLAAVGFLDDVRGVPVAVRLALQAVTAAIVSVGVVLVLDADLIWLVVAPVWIVGYLNAFNFMDGVNGISATHGGIVGAAWALGAFRVDDPVAGLVGLVLVAAAVGFLPYNFPIARAFLGDVGSYFFGTWIAVGAVVLSARIGYLVALLPTVVYVADTTWTLLRRVRSGRGWSEPHRDHVYQQLVRGGWSHPAATGVVGAVTAATGGLGLWASATASLPGQGAIVALAALLLGLYLALPHLVFESAPGLEPQDVAS